MAEATPFIEFMLQALLDAMAETQVTGSEKGLEETLVLLRAAPHLPARLLGERLGISPRTVEKQIAQLRKQGCLRRIGPAKGGHCELPVYELD